MEANIITLSTFTLHVLLTCRSPCCSRACSPCPGWPSCRPARSGTRSSGDTPCGTWRPPPSAPRGCLNRETRVSDVGRSSEATTMALFCLYHGVIASSFWVLLCIKSEKAVVTAFDHRQTFVTCLLRTPWLRGRWSGDILIRNLPPYEVN